MQEKRHMREGKGYAGEETCKVRDMRRKGHMREGTHKGRDTQGKGHTREEMHKGRDGFVSDIEFVNNG